MPASPATPQRSSKNRRSAPVTPGPLNPSSSQPLGLSDSNSVRDRIRQWQEQGAKIVSAPTHSDTSVAGDENAEVEAPFSPPPHEKECIRVAGTPPQRKSSRWVDTDNKAWVREARSSSTPRRRVISDEHWKQKQKQKRSPRSGLSTPKQEARHQKPRSGCTTKQPSARLEKEERRQRRKNARSAAGSDTIRDESAEIEVESIPSLSRRHPAKGERAIQSDLDCAVDDDLPTRFQSRLSPTESVNERRKSPRLSPKLDEKLFHRSQYGKMLDSHPETATKSFDGATGSIRSRKGGILNQAKEIFARSEPVQSTSQRLPSIEAWLDEQPDPFTDGNLEPVEIPAPLKTRSSRQEIDMGPNTADDPNRIWNYVDPVDHKPAPVTNTGRRRQRKSRRSQDAADAGSPESVDAARVNEKTPRVPPRAQDTDQIAEGVSSYGLKRRGAKALRIRAGSSPVKQGTPGFEPGPINSRPTAFLPREAQPKAVRPCPLTGIHRLSTIASVETFQSRTELENAAEIPTGESKGLQRRLTTHEDLMSVLSLPRAGGSIKSARSILTAKSRVFTANLDEVFQELEVDEARYMRELKTLVDGVIPVLLQCVLSKSDSAAAAGLFSSSGSACDDLNFTKPIVDMGVALERLKTLHRRIPTRDLNSLLSWAQSAHRVYIEYLKAWRLGFQDVVVNLAPAEDHKRTEIDEGMARDKYGDVVNSHGEKIDVAYLLKRPLVRIKNLAKLFVQVKILKPSSKASTVADQYDDLIKTARRRSNEEQSRLEDEAAANMDTTKARDVQTLALLSGVKIDRSRRVKARDCFSLTVHHSSGQRLDCHTELLLRQSQSGLAACEDLLICEVENNGKWLLFPPLETGSISARYGDNDGEIVLMVRGLIRNVHEWYELLLLKTNDIEAASEWVKMLATQPVPPKLSRSSSFFDRQATDAVSLSQDSTAVGKRSPLIPQFPGPEAVEVPIGESSVVGSDGYAKGITAPSVYQYERPPPLQSDLVAREHSLSQLPSKEETKALPEPPNFSLEYEQVASPHAPSSDTSSPGLRRAKVARRRQPRRVEGAASSPVVTSPSTPPSQPVLSTGTRKISRTDSVSREWMNSPDVQRGASSDREDSGIPDISQHSPDSKSKPQRPRYHRAISSTPSKELPTVHRRRPSSPVSTLLTQSIQDKWSAISSRGKELRQGKSPIKLPTMEDIVNSQVSHPGTPFADDVPTSPPHQFQSQSLSIPTSAEAGPVPPPHRVSPQGEPVQAVPALVLQQPSPRTGRRDDRRSSSPLKHEYALSTASSSDESEDESIASSSSETSGDGIFEKGDQATPLVPVQTAELRQTAKFPPPASLPNLPGGTLAPSNSASQAPYRTVPHLALQPNAPIFKTVATVCSWSEKGLWESLNPDECSIVVLPGLIEAYEMSAAHSVARTTNDDETISDDARYPKTDDQGIRPLVAFELTPLVPLRRGTALDISIRSPPTSRSKVKTRTNVMFRSRNAEECEALYASINHARINNPTWIALENARPKEIPNVTFNTGPGSARHSRSRSKAGSWFWFGSQGKKSSYRGSSAPLPGSPSIGGMSETSVGSMSSALSALRRFSGEGRFNLKRSSVVRKNGRFGTSGSASLYSSSSGATRTGGSASDTTSPVQSQLGIGPPMADQVTASAARAPGGTINNMKIRLYVRESAARWRDMGAARLNIMPAPVAVVTATADGSAALTDNAPSPPETASGSRPPSTFITGQPGQARGPRLPSSNHTPHRVHGNGNEKRVLITGKTRGEVLLDATLHESCFERIARTGIAVNVWEEHEEVAKSGGVVGGKGRTYMVQMKGEAEAAWAFGMVGRLRY